MFFCLVFLAIQFLIVAQLVLCYFKPWKPWIYVFRNLENLWNQIKFAKKSLGFHSECMNLATITLQTIMESWVLVILCYDSTFEVKLKGNTYSIYKVLLKRPHVLWLISLTEVLPFVCYMFCFCFYNHLVNRPGILHVYEVTNIILWIILSVMKLWKQRLALWVQFNICILARNISLLWKYSKVITLLKYNIICIIVK